MRTHEIGAAYYPERFDEKRWSVDAELMKKMGIRFIRTGEFAWSKLEKYEEEYNFSWLEKAVNLFGKYGIKTILCTPTAAPAPWITKKFPNILPITQEGKRFWPGQRRHYCFNNKEYQKLSARIVEELAKKFAGNSNIIGWQIDNELGGEEFICCCPVCENKFREWLRRKYHDIENLNKNWGGTFFSFEFTDWEEINVPIGHNLQFFNPSFRKDYLEFYSDSMQYYLSLQYNILHKYTDVPVTTNRYDIFWGEPYNHLMDTNLDVVSFDSYYIQTDYAAFHNDFYRSVKKEKPYWILEQNCETILFNQNPMISGLQTIQAFLKGAEKVCYFSWRQIGYGCEQDSCGGVIAQDGQPGETYDLLKNSYAKLQEIEKELKGFQRKAKTAILYSYQSKLIYDTSLMFSDVDYNRELVDNFYVPACRLGIEIDFLHDINELYEYEFVIVPMHIAANQGMMEEMENYVKEGGTVLVTGDFMYKSIQNHHAEREYSERLEKLTGIKLENILFFTEEDRVFMEDRYFDKNTKLHGFYRMGLEQQGAEVFGTLKRPGEKRLRPVVARNRVGKGNVYLMNALCDADYMKMIYRKIALDLGIEVFDLPDQLESISFENEQEDESCIVLFNKGTEDKTVVWRDNEIHIKANGYLLQKKI